MRCLAPIRGDFARLLDPEDPLQGVVFTSENQYSASTLIYRLATEALGVDPAELTVDRDYEDRDVRPEIVAVLGEHGDAEVLHEESGVRVRVTLQAAPARETRAPISSRRWSRRERGSGRAPARRSWG